MTRITSLITTSMFSLLSAHAALATPTIEAAQAASRFSEADAKALAPIIRQYILDNPEVLHQSLYAFQQKQEELAQEERRNTVKQHHDELYNNPHDPFIGPKDSKNVIIEFFDYNCGACKAMFRSLASYLQENKDTKVIFKEFPIFGESSVDNSRIGLAIFRLHPEKYKEFHGKMLTFEGRVDINQALKIVSELGLDPAVIRKEADNPEILEIISANQLLADKLKAEGTPTLIINDEIIGSAVDKDTLKEKLNGNTTKSE